MKRIAFAVLTIGLVLSLLVGCVVPVTPTVTPSPTATSVSPILTPTPTNGGTTVGVWEQLPSFGGDFGGEVFSCLAIDPGNPQTLYAGIVGDGIRKSNNSGANWAASSSGLPSRDAVSLLLRDVMSLALDPGNPQTLYAGIRGGGVYKSNDGGASWADFSSGLPISSYSDVRCLAIDPSHPQTLYAGTVGDGICKSTNGGASWVASSSGLPSPGVWGVWCLALDSSNPQTLYAGTVNGGVYKSTNGGASWAASSSGLPSRDVVSLALDPSNPPNSLRRHRGRRGLEEQRRRGELGRFFQRAAEQ